MRYKILGEEGKGEMWMKELEEERKRMLVDEEYEYIR